MTQYDIILHAFDLAMSSKIWPGTTPTEMLRIIFYIHSNKWLYVATHEGKISAVIVAFRIPEVTDENLTKMPVKESGNILYVPMVFSAGNGNMYTIVKESLRKYLGDNPDVTELVLQDKNEKLKRYSLKGDKYGKSEKAGITSNTHATV